MENFSNGSITSYNGSITRDNKVYNLQIPQIYIVLIFIKKNKEQECLPIDLQCLFTIKCPVFNLAFYFISFIMRNTAFHSVTLQILLPQKSIELVLIPLIPHHTSLIDNISRN